MRLGSAVWSIFALALVAEVRAQPPEKETWRAFETDHFQFYSNAPRGRTQELVDSFGRLQSLMARAGRSGLEQSPVTVLVFKSQRSMNPYLRTPPHTSDIATSWESYHTPERLWLLLNADLGDDVRVLAYRAYTANHLYAHMPDLPYWARHGLASFYSGFRDKKGTEVAVGLPLGRHLATLRSSTLMPWRQFFQTGGDGVVLDQSRTLGLFNAQAWIAAHFLMTGGPTPELGGKFFTALRQGQSEEAILRELYGWSLEEFSNHVLNYLHAPALPYFPWDVGQLDVDEAMVRDVERAELLFTLASYLVEGHRPPPLAFTEAHLGPITDDPTVGARVRVLQARLQREIGDEDGARRLFEEALAMPSAGAGEWLQYASFLAQTEASDEDIRRAASKALAMGARGPQASALLAQTLTFIPETEEQIDLYESALDQLGSSVPHVAHNLALGHMRRDDYERAREVIETRVRPVDAGDAAELTQMVVHNQAIAEVNVAVAKGDLESAISAYDRAISEVVDAELKSRLSNARDDLQRRLRSEKQWQAVGEAVDLANSGRRTEAKQLLESTLEEGVTDDRLRTEIESLLARF